MKKVSAVLLSFVMCFAFLINAFAATHDCETFEITVPDEFGGSADDFYVMSEYDDGFDDFYYYSFDFIEYYGSVSIEIYEYFGRFVYNDWIEAESSDDYYAVLNQIAEETGKAVEEFNGCPAVILEDWRNDFEVIVCTDSYLYWIELNHGDTIIPEIDAAYDAIQGMAFYDDVSYYDGYSTYASGSSGSVSSSGSSSASSSGAGASSSTGSNNVVINNNINTQTTAKPTEKNTVERTTAEKHEKAQTTDPTLVVNTTATTVANAQVQATESTTVANAENNEGNNSNTGLIIAIIVAAVIIGGSLIAVCVVTAKKKNN